VRWVLGALGGGALVAFGLTLRRVLGLDGAGRQSLRGWVRLTADRECVYQSIALEIETQASILGVCLNDAMEQRDSGRQEIAWRLVGLVDSEWCRLAQIATGLLIVLVKYMPVARVVLPVRSIAARHFKSPTMVDYARMHEVFDQFVLRYKARFSLHIRVLRHAMETLTVEFARANRRGLQAGDSPNEIWNRLDLCFHDFDLITKEVLLSLRAFLACLPDGELHELTADLNALVARGVRTTNSSARVRSVAV
jgi:hypothetical protein